MATTCASGRQQFDLFDPCFQRHRGNPESNAANHKSSQNRRRMQVAVLDAIRRTGQDGMTCREAAAHFNKGMNAISGRFSELKHSRLIYKIGVRDGCGVFVANGAT